MRKAFCDGLLLLSLIMLLFVVVSVGLLPYLLLIVAAAIALYALLRFVRWFAGKVAPIVRLLVVLAFAGGMLWITAREVQVLGLDGIFVLAILMLFAWAILCPTNPKRARA